MLLNTSAHADVLFMHTFSYGIDRKCLEVGIKIEIKIVGKNNNYNNNSIKP